MRKINNVTAGVDALHIWVVFVLTAGRLVRFIFVLWDIFKGIILKASSLLLLLADLLDLPPPSSALVYRYGNPVLLRILKVQ